MPDDLYSLWLKVPPGSRPPDHYALLGLPRFCENQEQIEAAAQKQLDELDRHSLHNDIPRRDACHRMMNEVARARVALTNPQKRAAYDLTLDPGRKAPTPTPAAPKPQPLPAPHIMEPVETPQEPTEKRPAWLQGFLAKCRENPVLWIVPMASVAVIVGALIVVRAARQSPPNAVAVAVLPSSKPSPASVSQPSIAEPSHPPPGSEPRQPPATMPASPTTGHDSAGPANAPPPTVAIGKPKSPQPPTIAANLKPIPPANLRDKSSKLIDQIYGDDLAAAKTPKAKADLARKMFASVESLGEHDTDRYVLLARCTDLAIEAWDLDTAVAAIDAVGREFQFDTLKIKARAFDVLAESLTATQDQHALARQIDTLIDQAIQADRYDVATYIVHAAQLAAQAVNDPTWLGKADARKKEIDDAQAEFKKASEALSTLARNPADADANAIAGRFRCFVKDDWESGLPMVAAGSDAPCRALAVAELAHPTDPARILELADGWWDLREQSPAFERRNLTEHACSLYSAILPQITESAQARVEKRIDQANAILGRTIDLMPFISLPKDAMRGTWVKRQDGLLSAGGRDGFRDSNRYVRIGYRPPEEYDFRIEFVAPQDPVYAEQYLTHDGHLFGWQMGQRHYTNFTSHFGFDCVDRHFPNRTSVNGPALDGGQTFVSVVKVRRGSVSAYLNGQRLAEFKTDYSNLVLMRQMIDNPPQKTIGEGLGVGGTAENTNLPVLFTKIELTEITGHGSPIADQVAKP